MQTYNLKQFTDQPQTMAPPQVAAVRILLQKRAEMLAEHPPMPSPDHAAAPPPRLSEPRSEESVTAGIREE